MFHHYRLGLSPQFQKGDTTGWFSNRIMAFLLWKTLSCTINMVIYFTRSQLVGCITDWWHPYIFICPSKARWQLADAAVPFHLTSYLFMRGSWNSQIKIKYIAPSVCLAFKLSFTGFNLEEKNLFNLSKQDSIERLLQLIFYYITLWTASVCRSTVWFWTNW